ncbi:uncharacterized protein LOC125079215 isoform X3 [Lutra lutra]|uniref:uncharacterized protein LOC125079215 isoform X3 n=1 Tax=Lutra lutra TaxID=9657 RepID=UPI001FD3F752|nr:uncharacterized protein LOC125079215 isoform X3 [Lutra lutra]
MSELRDPESRTRLIQMLELQEPEPRSPHGIKQTKKPTRHKTSSHIVLKEETRMLGAAQLRCTIRANTYSSTLAMIGLFLIGFEITFFLVKREKIVWIQQSGMMLSGYLWLFSLLELFLANIVNSWMNQAFYHGSNLI